METIKLGRVGWIILAIVIVMIIAMAICSIRSSGEEEIEESKFSRFSARLKQLQQEIEDEMNSLRLTQEMKVFLEKKINRFFVLLKAVFIILFLTIASNFYLSGLDVITSLLSAAGVISFAFLAGSFLFLSRFIDVNQMIEGGKEFIRKMIYKKYGFDPTRIEVIQNIILIKQNEANEIKEVLQNGLLDQSNHEHINTGLSINLL